MSRTQKKNEQGPEYKQDLLKQLMKCQKEINKINEMTSEEMLTVEEKYEKLRKPLYEKRSEAINRLSNFWGTSFIKHRQLVGYMGEEGLRSIKSLKVELLEKIKVGYRIHLHFDENPYFENKVLTKEFRYGNTKSGNWTTSTSTPIQWKPGNNLLLAKQDNSSALYKNFFDWFSDNTNPNFDHIGDFIRDDLWINPLRYYCIETEPEDNDIEEKLELEDGGIENNKHEKDDDNLKKKTNYIRYKH